MSTESTTRVVNVGFAAVLPIEHRTEDSSVKLTMDVVGCMYGGYCLLCQGCNTVPEKRGYCIA